MVAFPAIVSGDHDYAFIFTHGFTDCWRVGLLVTCTSVIDKLCVLFSF